MFSSIEKSIKVLSILNRCEIVLGVLDKDTNEMIPATILNLDGTVEQIKLPVDEAVYFTEHGTLMFPARRFLDSILEWIWERFDLVYDQIVDGCFDGWTEDDIRRKLQYFEYEINSYIFGYLSNFDQNANFINNILEKEQEAQSVVNLSELKKYISCEIRIK